MNPRIKWTIPGCITFFSLFISCKNFSQNTSLSGELTGIADGQFVYLRSYPIDKAYSFSDSAKISQGRFSFTWIYPMEKVRCIISVPSVCS